MSKKIKLQAIEVLKLQAELTSLLKEHLSMSVKMDINFLLKSLEPSVEIYSAARLEFFKKNGKKEENETYSLPANLSDELKKELDDASKKEFEVVTKLKFDSFKDLMSDYPYSVFFKLFE